MDAVNVLFTTIDAGAGDPALARAGDPALAQAKPFCHACSMRKPAPLAGGFFLVLPIVLGFGWGLFSSRPMQGAILGLGVGLVLAAIVWALDRFRQRR